MSCEAEIAEAVRDRGSRYTVQRAKILAALRHAGCHLSADELRERVRERDPHAELSLSTVYRTLEHAAALRLITELRGASGIAVFEWNEPGARHHHLRCTVCGQAKEVDVAALGAAERELREQHGFEAEIRHLGDPGDMRVVPLTALLGGARGAWRARRAWAVLVAAAVGGLLLAACGDSDREDDGRLRVVTTVSPITSIVENIGGDRIHLVGVVPEGVNSHTYDPSPSVARELADADLVVLNGLRLEEPTLELAEANAGRNATILLLGDGAVTRDQWVFDFSFPERDGRPNPHLWTDPLLALRYAELVEGELSRLDPANAGYYAANLEAFRARITALDAAITAAVATVPEAQRRLVTYHDSWPYFARRYGFEVLGAVQPSDFSDPSPRELASLIEQVRSAGVAAVFGSEVFPSEVLATIATESGATYVDELRDDDLPGDPGDERHSYLGLMVANMEIMLPALGGNADAVAAIDTGLVFEGASTASYAK